MNYWFYRDRKPARLDDFVHRLREHVWVIAERTPNGQYTVRMRPRVAVATGCKQVSAATLDELERHHLVSTYCSRGSAVQAAAKLYHWRWMTVPEDEAISALDA